MKMKEATVEDRPYKAYTFKGVKRIKGPDLDCTVKHLQDCGECAASTLNFVFFVGRARLTPKAYTRKELRKLEQAAEDISDYNRLFSLQHRRIWKATKLWRAEDPKARRLTSPDLGALLEWLMARKK